MDNDLISRSALLKEIEPDKGAMRGVCFFGKMLAMNLEALKRMIIQAPAVDAEPVRHGRWIKENIRAKSYLRLCSVCNRIAYFCGEGCSYTYCPNCGAKMDAEVQDG